MLIKFILRNQNSLGKYFFANQNHYQLLGVKQSATAEEIKSQFHKLAKKYHPDSPNSKDSDQEIFKTIVQAYNVLSNEEERQKYNRTIQEEQQFKQSTQYTQQQRQQQEQNRQYYKQQQHQYYENIQKQFKERQQNYDFSNFQTQNQRDKDLGEYPFLASLRQAPELYVITTILFVIMFRWYTYMLEERQKLDKKQFSYPEDPEFIKEKNRDHIKRFGKPAYPTEQKILFKVADHECKKIPLQILSQMEESGKYQMSKECYDRIDEFRAEMGAQFLIDDEEDEEEEYRPQYKNYRQQNFQDQMSNRAQIFRTPKRGVEASHLSNENINKVFDD